MTNFPWFLCFLDVNPCTLLCLLGSVAYPKGNVIDGTRCSSDRYDYDVCIQGQCQVMPLAINGRYVTGSSLVDKEINTCRFAYLNSVSFRVRKVKLISLEALTVKSQLKIISIDKWYIFLVDQLGVRNVLIILQVLLASAT